MSFIEYKSPSLPFSGTFDQAKRKKIKDMEFGISITTGNAITKKANFGLAIRLIRVAMFAVMIPFFFSCAQPDTIAPAAVATEAYAPSARESTSLLGTDNFEDKAIAKFWRTELRTANAGVITADKHRSGKQAMRFTWTPAQANGTNDMLHSELAVGGLQVDENERWYGYSSFMPSASMANDNQTVIVSQWHGQADPGFEDSVPPVAISVEPGNKLQVVYRASNVAITKPLQHPTTQVITDMGAAKFDQWVDFVIHVKWDATGTTGLLEIWQDGVKIISKQGISIGYPQMHKPYFKAGLYCWTGQSKFAEKAIYYDEVRIGGATSSYNDVKPGRNDNTAK